MQKSVASPISRSSKAANMPPAISYRLSEKMFLDLGWTSKPLVSVVYPVIIMKAKFSHSVISPWFRLRDKDVKMLYPNGKVLCLARRNGTGKVFYPNGKLALEVERGGKQNERTRVWVYSSGEVDINGERFSPRLCALFDSTGNGVVYDAHMKKRLVYNQNEGMLFDTPAGIPLIWKWHNFLYKGSFSVMNDEDTKDNLLIEPPKPILWVTANSEKENRKGENSLSVASEELTKSECEFREAMFSRRYVDTGKKFPKMSSPVKPIVLRINKYLALRIISQSDISLSFFTGSRQTTLKLGILYNPFDKLKVAEIDPPMEKVLCTFESLPAQTRSMVKFKKIVKKFSSKS